MSKRNQVFCWSCIILLKLKLLNCDISKVIVSGWVLFPFVLFHETRSFKKHYIVI